MCGIAGLIKNPHKVIDGTDVAKRMAAQLRHRGPDGASYYEDDNALLVHTRLSIIDLSTGQQPIHNENKRIWVIFNGEIFNYLELRNELISKGHSFYTQTDTEVIVHLYEEYGLDFVSYLNGQFSICLWDTVDKTAILVRDRVGITPLFYSESADGLWFGSEVKAILAGKQNRPELNVDAAKQIAALWGTVAPTTVFKDVSELAPGHLLIVNNGKITEHCYWDCTFPMAGTETKLNENEVCEQLSELLFDAVKIRLRADVPVGAYLSGGLDSSIIAAIVDKVRQSPLRTFSLTFADPELDESRFQTSLTRKLNIDHTSSKVDSDELLKSILKTVWHTEAPMIRTAPIPMGQLSATVRANNFKVVLTGEGADEVFGGYDLFKESKLRHFWARSPDSTWRATLLKRLYPYLQLSRSDSGRYLENFFGVGVEEPDDPLFSHLPRMSTTQSINAFLSPTISQQQSDLKNQLEQQLPNDFWGWSNLAKAQYLEIKTLMAGYLLNSQGDRMLMMNSVEGRFPYLDHRLIEFANQLPAKLKIKVLKEKYILKKALGHLIPQAIVARHKLPYRAPMGIAFNKALGNEVIADLMSATKLTDYGYFEPQKVMFLMKKAQAMRTSYKDDMALTFILSTQAWHYQFIDRFHEHFVLAKAPKLERIT